MCPLFSETAALSVATLIYQVLVECPGTGVAVIVWGELCAALMD